MHEPNKIKQLGQYPTPLWAAEALVERYFPKLSNRDVVVEPSCGPGAFLAAIPPEITAIGVEIDPDFARAAEINTGRQIILGDFQTVELGVEPTLVVGNPPFNLSVIDGFLRRADKILPMEGQAAFILPAYAFQTAARVEAYAKTWSLRQELIPRNIFPGLSLPLLFAIFSKSRNRTLVGFALYGETTAVQSLAKDYRRILGETTGAIWKTVVEQALNNLGGEANVSEIYSEVGGRRPTENRFWQPKVRQTLRRYKNSFEPTERGRYRLVSN